MALVLEKTEPILTTDQAIPVASEPGRSSGSMLAAMAVPGYPRLWAVGLLMNLTRWMTIFLCSYLVNQLTHSAILVQLVGASLFAPMFLGGAVAGTISDRLDRRRTLMTLVAVLAPASALMAVINLSGNVQAWMIYPFTLAVGTGLLADMTARRALVYDFVGPANITNALALEAIAMTSGAMLGSLSAGTVISTLGIGETFLLITAVYIVAMAFLKSVPSSPRRTSAGTSAGFLSDIAAGLRYVRKQPTLVSILGVTVIVNLFYFSYVPMIPIFGERLGVGAFWTSLLMSSNAVGSIIGASFIARGLPIGRGQIYVAGSTLALTFLLIFAAIDWYPAALLALMTAGFGLSGFATMQSVLVMVSADEELRGRAMGMLSMSIGVLPFSMLLLGGVAQAIGPSPAVILSVTTGLACLALWSYRRPEALRLR